MTLISVITPSIPERSKFLYECKRSVGAQGGLLDVDDQCSWEHLVEVDEERNGCAMTMNRLANRAMTSKWPADWLLPLADDDLLLPGALASLLAASDEADVVYSPPLVTGNEDRWWFFQAPPVIPSCALIRASLWRDLGGYDESLKREEDRDLWVKALAAEARFVRVDDAQWIYRQWRKPDGTPGNKSFAASA